MTTVTTTERANLSSAAQRTNSDAGSDKINSENGEIKNTADIYESISSSNNVLDGKKVESSDYKLPSEAKVVTSNMPQTYNNNIGGQDAVFGKQAQ